MTGKHRIAILIAFVLSLFAAAAVAETDTLTLPADLTTIEAEAFYGTDAVTIIVPEGVTSIGPRAFGGSANLKEIRVSTSDDLRISDDALEGSPNASFVSSDAKWDGVYKYSTSSSDVIVKKYMGMITGTLEIPSQLGGLSITRIGDNFLKGRTDFTKVVIPEGVNFIEKNAFRDCANLTDITFPSTLERFYAQTSFYGCGSAATEPFYFILPDNITETVNDDASTHGFTGCNAVLVCNPGTTTAYNLHGYMTFPGQYDYRYRYDNKKLRLMKYVGTGNTANIPSGVEIATIYKNAFENCTNLTKVVIPEGITFIEEYAFKGCSNLTDITFPDSLTNYYKNSFDGCGSNAKETFYFVLPDNITTTLSGNETTHNCFDNCNAVVVCNPGTTTAYNTNGNCYITFPGYLDYRFVYKDNDHNLWLMDYVGNSEEITLPHSDDINIKVLNEELFNGCTFLKKVVVPEGVWRIGASVFEDCRNLEEITLPSTITWIGQRAFRYTGANVKTVNGKKPVLLLPEGISQVDGQGQNADQSTFYYCGLNLVAKPGSYTATQLSSKGFDFWGFYDAEKDELSNYVKWEEQLNN